MIKAGIATMRRSEANVEPKRSMPIIMVAMGARAPAAVTAIMPNSAPMAMGMPRTPAKADPSVAPMTNKGVMMPPLIPRPKVTATKTSFQPKPKSGYGPARKSTREQG